MLWCFHLQGANLIKRKQVDSSLSKNQIPISYTTNDVTIKSHDHGLISKVCIAMQNPYGMKPNLNTKVMLVLKD